ncbi:glycoside-pentoside-hexuronide (GPH):cation symporter [Levilactobacillus bambusae]|uniref:MFS transporter n=1 Tax=Levilactobacillus bambusae TaxID=2024736 RepID=A0A2V1MYM5_9LACO|nr:glycoside-pentoside-hexuronide (GPH):cation symporter [Levilactobacillus bambusae]PWG00111.1 MFS transporter [Levilactobacillus bambusae]
MKQINQYFSYAFGAFGHDAFYATLSTYFMMFVTSQLFDGDSAAQNAKMIGYVTTMIVVIRLVEIMFDPLIGGLVDNTETKWGKFKPWLFVGALISGLMLMLIFTNFGGLTVSNPMLYLILFAIAFVILDIFYSFKDISFWSMLPALSLDSKTRTKFGTIARFGSTLGAQGVAIIIVPLVVYFSHIFSGTTGQTQTRTGWFWFAVVIAVVSFLGALATCLGTKEQTNAIREQTEHTRFRDVFKVIGENDQLMWLAFSYFLFALSYVVTNSLLIYYFRYIMGKPTEFSLVGVETAILGVISVAIFPLVESWIKRRAIYMGGIAVMLLGYVTFLFAGTNLTIVLIGVALFFFPYPMVFLATLMTITDSVEYGQLKNGTRNESVTLSVRPLIDKLAGAFANGIVAFAAIAAGMTGSAKASSISASGILQFKTYMFYAPMILLVIAAIIFARHVKLSEAEHAKIVAQLENNLDNQD